MSSAQEPRSAMGDYWREVLPDWEDSSYNGGKNARGIERIGSRFRQHIIDRQETCIRDVEPYLNQTNVVEIGCASGDLTLRLVDAGPRHILGLDVAEKAIQQAQVRATSLNLEESRIEFRQHLIGDRLNWTDSVDIVIGLGITEYVHKPDLVKFFQDMRPTYFFLSFDEKVVNFQKLLHLAYRQMKGLPYYIRYRQAEIITLMESAGFTQVRAFRDGANAFVTNLPN